MRVYLLNLIIMMLFAVSTSTAGPIHFTQAEQQQIFVPTTNLFARSDAFSIDFSALGKNDYFFPLPVGNAKVVDGQYLDITTTKGDAVKAILDELERVTSNENQ